MTMSETETGMPVKLALLSVALAWFSFTVYEFAVGIFNRSTTWPIVVQDIPGEIGMAFRTAGGFIAVVTVLIWIFSVDFTKREAIMAIRLILLCEVITFLSLLPSGLFVFIFPELLSEPIMIVESLIPVLTEAVLIPIVVMKVFFELSPNRRPKNAIKWALITGTSYIFVIWLNYTCNWFGTMIASGVEYVTAYPINILSFCLTAFGLLGLTLYSARFARESSGTLNWGDLDKQQIGYIMTFFGLYFVGTYFLWLMFGNVGGWSIWHAWFLNHNVDLWMLTFPILGLALILYRDQKK
jgi:hypothetical protein